MAPNSTAIRDTHRNIIRFFTAITDEQLPNGVSIVAVAHLLRGTLPYIDGLARLGTVSSVLAKPKSINADELSLIGERYRVDVLNRTLFQTPAYVVRLLKEIVRTERFLIADIGGYFAPHIDQITELVGPKLLGIVEDTENGLQRYERSPTTKVPVISIARSEIKASEDYLVGEWVVFSAEALMREFGSILNGRLAVVIGYGRIGRSIARHLQMRGVTTTIVETNPIRAIEAKAHGFIIREKHEALRRGNVFFCATGVGSLLGDDFLELRSGSYVASVTSAEDELDLTYTRETYQVASVTDHIERFERPGQFFYLLNSGDAVNFVHKGGLGPFIAPVQGEILAAVTALIREGLKPGIQELEYGAKIAVAREWLKIFQSVNTDS